MRILGFSKKWKKLYKPIHTTFRFSRKDKDWEVGEYVQEVYHPRNKDREVMNPKCLIVEKKNLWCFQITDTEAVEDGFEDSTDMCYWLAEAHGKERLDREQIHKLTIKVIGEGVD